MKYFKKTSLKNKIFFSTLAVILLLSIVIALLARWTLVSSLTNGLKQRGLGIAFSIAENSRGYILTENRPELTSIMFDARQGERKSLIAYVFIVDKESRILAHSFITEFPKWLPTANPVTETSPHRIQALTIGPTPVYDIAVAVNEGIYQIATVHVGLKKSHIDVLVSKLRTTFLGFITAITILFFWISHLLSKHVTRPIFQLVRVSDEISRGHLDIKPDAGSEVRCWDVKHCDKKDCPAHGNTALPCWYVDETACSDTVSQKFPEKLETCQTCEVYHRFVGDEVVQLAHSFANMTVRLKSSEVEIRESEGKYRSLFDSGPNPIFVLDRETLEIRDANPSAVETYGYPKEELIGMPFSKLGGFEYKEMKRMTAPSLAGPRDCIVTEKQRHLKRGDRPFFVKVKACPAWYGGRETIIVAATDITDSIEKDAQLVQASKMTTLGEMSAGIAHELNQPLNVIRMGSDYLKMMVGQNRFLSEKNLKLLANEISGQVDRASDIIKHLREFSRKPNPEQHPVHFSDPIESVLGIMGQQLKLQNIVVNRDLDETLPPLLANRYHLEQVFFNLISNARDAIIQSQTSATRDQSGIIAIRSFREQNQVVATVSDNGAGIPEEIQDRIFEPFFTTKDVGKGMGLGLSVIYGIVQDYGGRIAVDSARGKQTTFRLSFPMMSDPDA